MASYIANDMRVGWVISHNGKRYSVTSITKVKPGKGGAFVQADLRDIDSGNKGGDRWRAEDKVEKLMVEKVFNLGTQNPRQLINIFNHFIIRINFITWHTDNFFITTGLIFH